MVRNPDLIRAQLEAILGTRYSNLAYAKLEYAFCNEVCWCLRAHVRRPGRRDGSSM
jgi:hypothetical protein